MRLKIINCTISIIFLNNRLTALFIYQNIEQTNVCYLQTLLLILLYHKIESVHY